MLGLKIFVAPEDPFLSEHGVMHEGQVSTRLGLSGIPVLAETLALAQELILIEDTGVSAHFGRLSSGHSVELLRSAHDKGLIVTSDTAIHQLYLTEVDVHLDSGLCHVRPPFRNISDKNGLRAGIANYLITAITSDHKTLPLLVKEVPFQDSEPGIASWPVLLPLVLRLATEEQIPLTTALACITHQPAKILGIDAGHLKLGARADVTIFDPKEHWTFDKNDLDNFGHNTPFANWQLQGRVKCTIIDGEIAYRNKTTPSP
jgi:dihydroorotase